MERRLAAIFAADVVGYSRLMEADEEATVRTLNACRQVIDGLVADHQGRVFGSAGDSVVAEFPSPVEAVRCAVDIQRELEADNVDLPEDRRMRLRIGVNLGDVIVEGDNLLGDGVNIAARLETLADAGGICLSRPVFDQIKKQLDLGYEYLGEHAVKNITEPVQVYRVLTEPEAAGKVIGETAKATPGGRWIALAAALALVVGAVTWQRPWEPTIESASVERMAFPLPEKPSIAVLPFDNLSGDAEQDILIDGLVEDIITSLSKIPSLFVIARNSTFAYKGKPVKVQQVAEELGVHYVLEGSVRASGDKKRFTAQLIDAVAGNHVWADSYDRELKDIFALQSEIAQRIVTELDIELVPDERARLQRRTTSNPEAYEIFLRAEAAPTANRENNLAKIKLYEQAIELDPDFSAAWAASAIRHAMNGRLGWEDRDLAYEKSEKLARKAISLNDTYSGAYLALSTVHRFRAEFEESLALVEKALDLAPNDADAIMYKGRMLRLLPGRAEEAIPLIKSAMRLNPHYPANYVSQLGWAYFAAGQFEEAHDAALEFVSRQPNRDHAHWRLAMTYSLLGQPEKARTEAAEALRINPNRTIARHLKLAPYAKSNPALMKSEIDAMRAAGFPEE